MSWFDEDAKTLSSLISNSDDFQSSNFKYDFFKFKKKYFKTIDSSDNLFLNNSYANIFNYLNRDSLFSNVLSNVKYSDVNFNFNIQNTNENNIKFNNSINLPSINDNNKCLSTHKYEIKFSKKQHTILQTYFTESINLYNFCVEIFNKYPEINTNWMILKDIIFYNVYRTNIIDNNNKIKVSDSI